MSLLQRSGFAFYLYFISYDDIVLFFEYSFPLWSVFLQSPDDMKSMAVEAVLLLQEYINDENAEKVKMQLLVPSKVVGCVIGKNGSVINEIRKRTNANIHILKGNRDDRVEVIILIEFQIFLSSVALFLSCFYPLGTG